MIFFVGGTGKTVGGINFFLKLLLLFIYREKGIKGIISNKYNLLHPVYFLSNLCSFSETDSSRAKRHINQ